MHRGVVHYQRETEKYSHTRHTLTASVTSDDKILCFLIRDQLTRSDVQYDVSFEVHRNWYAP